MSIFDKILPEALKILDAYRLEIARLDWLLLNRDLNGKVRLILPEAVETDKTVLSLVSTLTEKLSTQLGRHAYLPDTAALYEASREVACQGAASYALEGFDDKVWLVDRLAVEGNWAQIAEETQGAKRIVFFSIKGGVGRSTALAAVAWNLAQARKRVLVVDLDLESPGLSSALLPEERRPEYGITDWLVEDLVDNADAVLDSMIATSDLARDGEIFVVPAHGQKPGEYIAKLGRVWMSKLLPDGTREPWSDRLKRLLQALEERISPDVILIDSRAGIDEVASACVTDLGANLVLLFALEGSQTWSGYRILFEHWQRAHAAEAIRERLQIVAALVPETDSVEYLEGLRENSYDVFTDTLFDEIAPPSPDAVGPTPDDERKWRVGELAEGWNFDEADESSPHYPQPVKWNRSFAGLRSLQGRLAGIDASDVNLIFGPLLEVVANAIHSVEQP
jgi:hypothetical protein